MATHFLVLDRECPGSEHDSWEEAKTYLDKIVKAHGPQPDARIIGPNTKGPLWEEDRDPYFETRGFDY